MNLTYLRETQVWVREELKRSVDFWLEHGMDDVHGGVYTCIDRTGRIYSTDKSVWMQGRCGWIFAYLCHLYGAKEQWLQASKSCLDFLEKYCINPDADGRMYFTVTEDGQPLRQRRYYYSEAFYCIANAEYYGVTGEEEHLARAKRAYEIYWSLSRGGKDATGLGPKGIVETRSGRSLGIPMIMLNVTSIMRRVDPENAPLYDERADICVHDILTYHHKPELGCTLENVGPDGEIRDKVTEGRIVNPGHDIECSWFLMEYANLHQNAELHKKAEEIFRMAIEHGWDDEYGGLLYFIDCLGNPPESYEHDMKLWWPHNEIMIASMMAYRDTKDEYYLDWFKKTLEYCKEVFSDPAYGDWYGYLRRDGKPTMPAAKGSTFKGPFHLPRALCMVDMMLDEMLQE